MTFYSREAPEVGHPNEETYQISHVPEDTIHSIWSVWSWLYQVLVLTQISAYAKLIFQTSTRYLRIILMFLKNLASLDFVIQKRNNAEKDCRLAAPGNEP